MTASDSDETLRGYKATGSGGTEVILHLSAERARLTLLSRWMGDNPTLHVELECRHRVLGSHYGVLVLERARSLEPEQALTLPPSDGVITLEYVRVPLQKNEFAGNDTMAMVGTWNDVFSMVLWLHPDAMFDDGTDLDPSEYEVPIESFRPVARMLKWFDSPWKLGPESDSELSTAK
jgi:hypothetical protein